MYLAIGLSIVRCSPNLLYAYKLTKLSEDVAFIAGPSVTQERGWCSEDQDLILPQKLSNNFHSLIGGPVYHDMFLKMATTDQTVYHILGFIQLHHGFNAGRVNMQQLQRYSDDDGSHGDFGMNAFMLDALHTAANCPLHLSSHAGPPDLVIQQAQCPLLGLVSSITVTYIHGSYPASLWDHTLQNFLQFTCRGVAMVKTPQERISFFCSWRIVIPSSVLASSPSFCLRSHIFQPEIYLVMVLSGGSSCWVVTQSVTYTSTHAA